MLDPQNHLEPSAVSNSQHWLDVVPNKHLLAADSRQSRVSPACLLFQHNLGRDRSEMSAGEELDPDCQDIIDQLPESATSCLVVVFVFRPQPVVLRTQCSVVRDHFYRSIGDHVE